MPAQAAVLLKNLPPAYQRRKIAHVFRKLYQIEKKRVYYVSVLHQINTNS